MVTSLAEGGGRGTRRGRSFDDPERGELAADRLEGGRQRRIVRRVIVHPGQRGAVAEQGLRGRVRRAAYRADTLDRWWSDVSGQLGAPAPRQRDRRLELATLLREPPLPVIAVLRESLPALLLRVRIIAEAVAEQRKAARG